MASATSAEVGQISERYTGLPSPSSPSGSEVRSMLTRPASA